MFQHLRRLVPSREQIAQHRWLRWLGPSLLHPRLWHFSRRGVAIGVALGVFFGLLVPIAQIPLAAGSAVLLRANVPAAVGATLVTNPLTFAPLYILAHRLGNTILGKGGDAAIPAVPPHDLPADAVDAGWWETLYTQILALGKPLLLGLGVLAASGGILTYGAIMLVWRIRTAWIWKRSRRRKTDPR